MKRVSDYSSAIDDRLRQIRRNRLVSGAVARCFAFIVRVKHAIKTQGFSRARQVAFIQDLNSWLQDGSSPAIACHAIIKFGQNNPKLAHEVAVATAIYDALQSGKKISRGLKDWFSADIVMLFETGQEAGIESLGPIISAYLKQEESIKHARKEFFSPLKYPLIMSVMAWTAVYMYGTHVLPKFLDFMPSDRIPFVGQVIMYYVSAVQSWGVLVALMLVFFAIWSADMARNNASALRLAMDPHFPLNIYKNFVAMRALKTLGILIETNYSPYDAARKMAPHASPYLRYHLDYLMNQISRGNQNLASALDSGLLPVRLLFRVENALKSENQQAKRRAISTAADRAGDEAIVAMSSTRQVLLLILWCFAGGGVVMLALGMLGMTAAVGGGNR